MSLTGSIDLQYLNNENEKLVLEELETQMKDRDDLCHCEVCLLDMVCYAMNNLKPRYSASLLGSLYSQADSKDNLEEVSKVVSAAIKRVSKNPAHTD